MRPYVLLYVTDPGRSQPWYGALGFRLRREHRHGSWAELEWAGGGEVPVSPSLAPRSAGPWTPWPPASPR